MTRLIDKPGQREDNRPEIAVLFGTYHWQTHYVFSG
jgi:hypothetical protein